MAIRLSLLLGFAVAAVGISRSLGASPVELLKMNKEKWSRQVRRHGSADYTMVVRRTCYCLPEFVAPVKEQVANSIVQCAFYQPEGEGLKDLAGRTAKYTLTIEQLFKKVEDALFRGNNFSRLSVVYNDELGYPSRLSIDENYQIADDEIEFIVSHVRLGVDRKICPGLPLTSGFKRTKGKLASDGKGTHTRVLLPLTVIGISLTVLFFAVMIIQVLCRRQRRSRTCDVLSESEKMKIMPSEIEPEEPEE